MPRGTLRRGLSRPGRTGGADGGILDAPVRARMRRFRLAMIPDPRRPAQRLVSGFAAASLRLDSGGLGLGGGRLD